MDKFTKKELFTISDGILALMEQADKAKQLTKSPMAHTAIENELMELAALNSKVLSLVKEE